MPYSQNDKLISIDTPLGADALLLTGLSGAEAVSSIFSFELSLVSENHAISFEAIIGKNVTVTINLPDGNKRYLNGIISSFSQGRGGGEEGGDARFTYYRATMVPWFWILTRSADSRIFQNHSVVEIVESIFKDQGFTDYRLDLRGSYDKREFCVQYAETAFNFVSRLLEEEGIFYFFEHDGAKHTMVLADTTDAHKPCPGQRTISCQLSLQAVRDCDVITAFELTQQIGPARYSLNDFNFTIPNTTLNVEAKGRDAVKVGKRHIYDYPGNFRNRSAGEAMAIIRMEAEEAHCITIRGASDCRSFVSGFRFTLKDHSRPDLNDKDYLLLSVTHQASEGFGGDDAGAHYENSFECLPCVVPYRPRRLTPKPVVQGTQTAIIVGAPGEEIHTDQHGRVKVHFHWDRDGNENDNSSCWIRVGQLCAANGWGALQIPRVGQEVVVHFLEGDPDRPIITGQLYNGVNLPPYPLPAHKTRSTMKSNSSPGGEGFNEIRFEDKKGEEQLFIHAQRQQDNRVNDDALEWVGKDRHLIVGRNQYEKVSGDQHLTVTGDRSEKVDGTVSLTVSEDMQQRVGAKHALNAGEEIHLKAGTRLIIESGRELSLKVGGNFINITPAGVTIVGTMVLINSGGLPGFGSGASPEIPKMPKEADGDAPGEVAAVPHATPAAAEPQAAALKSAAKEHKFFCDG